MKATTNKRPNKPLQPTPRPLHLASPICMTLLFCALIVGPILAVAAQPSSHSVNWVKVADETEFAPRDSITEIVCDGRMWLMGGWFNSFETPPHDVWKSADGKTWTLATNQAPWTHSDFAMGAAFKDRMWIMGGWCNGRLPSASATNEVWSSRDGNRWELAGHAGWSPRLAGGCVVFHDKIWVIGGTEQYYFGDATSLKNDVWNSADGKTWHRVVAAAPWSPRAFHRALVFGGKLWVLGGGNYLPDYQAVGDVWCSEDGANWSRVTDKTPWSPRIWSGAAVYRNQMWFFGGWSSGRTEDSGNWNDIWHSKDGKTWEVLQTGIVWIPRHAPAVLIFHDKLWVIAGKAGPTMNDVWSLHLPVDWR